jgi:hypothetical protein
LKGAAGEHTTEAFQDAGPVRAARELSPRLAAFPDRAA